MQNETSSAPSIFETEALEKLRAALQTHEATIDALQGELKQFETLRASGFLPKDGEPFFILLARDPFALHLVETWALLRMGRIDEARNRILAVMTPTLNVDLQSSNDPQIQAAFKIARDMDDWTPPHKSAS